MTFWQWLYRISARRVRAQHKGMVCAECGCAIHKHDRFKVLEAKHRNCKDPKGVGQLALPE